MQIYTWRQTAFHVASSYLPQNKTDLGVWRRTNAAGQNLPVLFFLIIEPKFNFINAVICVFISGIMQDRQDCEDTQGTNTKSVLPLDEFRNVN